MQRRSSSVVTSLVVCVAALCFSPQSGWATSSSPNAQRVKIYHDGSIRDLDAIGSRNVGCGRGVGNWYSLEKQIAMGKDYAQQVEQSSKLVTDPVVTEYVNRVGQNLVRNSDAQVPFTIKVIDSDEVNAFALPGGFFVCFRQSCVT
jgi:predicted Zn-dependent protease